MSRAKKIQAARNHQDSQQAREAERQANRAKYGSWQDVLKEKPKYGEIAAIRLWRTKRNRLVSQLLEADPKLLREDALKIANQQMGPMPGSDR